MDFREKCLGTFTVTLSLDEKWRRYKMRKILLPMVTLLVLSVMLIAPTMAKTEVPYSSHIESALVDPGKQWVTEDGILHIRDSYWKGTEVGTLGSGTFEDWLSLNINVATGEGTFSSHWLLTYEGRGTISGSARGTISMGYLINGTFIGTHGNGEFEHVQKKGSLDGYLAGPTLIVLDAVGTVYYP